MNHNRLNVVHDQYGHSDDEGENSDNNNDDDYDEYERVLINESFDAEQEHVNLRPAPPELIRSMVTEVCTAEINIEYQCVICMEEFIIGIKIHCLPCSHCFS